MNSPSFLRSTICRSRLTRARLSVSGGGDWARATPLAGIAASAARNIAAASRINRLLRRSFGLSVKSFTSLRSGSPAVPLAPQQSVNDRNAPHNLP